MAAVSTHWADVARWLYQVMDSCEKPIQIINARKLVRLFAKKYCQNEPFGGPINTTYDSLINYNDEKLNTLLIRKKTKNEQKRSDCPDAELNWIEDGHCVLKPTIWKESILKLIKP